MKNKSILVILILLFIIVLNFQLLNGKELKPQAPSPLFLNAIASKNGLEISDYKNVYLLINDLDEDAKKIGLTKERIETKCELRLRQAGLKPEPWSPSISKFEYLNITVHVMGPASGIVLSFHRPAIFEVEKILHKTIVTAWGCSGIGIHENDPDYIIQGLDKYLDLFINEYLKANAK